jgi:hypothetical protein
MLLITANRHGAASMVYPDRIAHRAARASRRASMVAMALLIVGTFAGCRSGSNPNARSSASSCDQDAPGTLRVANSSGRVLDVYATRPSTSPQLLTQVSPGTSTVSVPGPSDLGVRYDVIDPNARQVLSTVNWNRRTGRETMVGVVMELTCRAASA